MKRQLKRLRLVRPADAFLPLALLAAALCGHGAAAAYLFGCLWGARLLALSTAGSLRAAFALQPSIRDVRGSVKLALLLQPFGAALAAAALRLMSPEWLAPRGLSLIAGGLLLNLEQAFYEYLYSAGDGGSALMARLITAALTFAGLCLWETLPAALPIATGAAMLAACAVALTIGGSLKSRLNPQPLRAAPLCLLQDVLYPAAFAGIMILLPRVAPGIATPPARDALVPWDAAFFAGLTVYSLCRTAFRRSRSEARPLHLALLIVSVTGVLIALPALLWPEALAGLPGLNGYGLKHLPILGTSLILASLCVFALFGNPGRGE